MRHVFARIKYTGTFPCVSLQLLRHRVETTNDRYAVADNIQRTAVYRAFLSDAWLRPSFRDCSNRLNNYFRLNTKT